MIRGLGVFCIRGRDSMLLPALDSRHISLMTG